MTINFSTSTGTYRWRPAAWLRAAGGDAHTFLQGQFSNDLRPLTQATSTCIYGLWLTAKGRVLADSFILRGASPDEFWIGSYFSPGASLRERLENHIVADDVVIEDATADWMGLSVLGARAERILGGGSRPDVFVFPGRRTRAGGAEAVFRVAAGEPAGITEPPITDLTADDIARLRIADGIPAIPVDLGPADLPHEAGLEVEAVSGSKGCYVGQEVMARLKSVRRRLVRVSGPAGPIPGVPAPLFAQGRPIGELRTVVGDGAGGWIGLALVQRWQVAADSRVSLAATDAPALAVLDLK
ncbi:MAG: folate-binding protein [Verrucomicrobia bacterium]|nr:folate-binding protein [Verrucomicrobiota bacterium]